MVPTEDLKEAGQVVLSLLSQSLENHLAKDLEETPLPTPLNVTPLKDIDLSLSVKKSDIKVVLTSFKIRQVSSFADSMRKKSQLLLFLKARMLLEKAVASAGSLA